MNDSNTALEIIKSIGKQNKIISEQRAEVEINLLREIETLQKERDELLFALDDVVDQACWINHLDLITLDSCAITAYANGMRLLAKYGLIVIESDIGRRVLGKRTDALRDE